MLTKKTCESDSFMDKSKLSGKNYDKRKRKKSSCNVSCNSVSSRPSKKKELSIKIFGSRSISRSKFISEPNKNLLTADIMSQGKKSKKSSKAVSFNFENGKY